MSCPRQFAPVGLVVTGLLVNWCLCAAPRAEAAVQSPCDARRATFGVGLERGFKGSFRVKNQRAKRSEGLISLGTVG